MSSDVQCPGLGSPPKFAEIPPGRWPLPPTLPPRHGQCLHAWTTSSSVTVASARLWVPAVCCVMSRIGVRWWVSGRGAIMPGDPAAFMSYVRFNDQHDEGQLSQFRERLSAEVRVQTGEEFLIFQDRHDIAWGQNWQQRLDQALDAVTLLLVIITPGFFRSPACRAEVERFLARERDLGREDLILPVYSMSAPELDDPERRDADEVARVLASRQFADWRDLRFEPFTSPMVRKAMAQLATRM